MIASVFAFGQDMTLFCDASPSGRSFKGFLQPLNSPSTSSYSATALHTPPGLADNRRFRLFAPPSVLSSDDANVSLSCDGRSYSLVHAEPLFFNGDLTHWEAVLRPTM